MSARIPLPAPLGELPFSLDRGRAAGLGRRRMQGSDLERPFRGVRQKALPRSVAELCRAYATRMPRGGVFCSVTAAVLLGVPLPTEFEQLGPLHVAVPLPSRAPRARGTVGHSLALTEGDVVQRLGLPLTSAARTWCDLAPLLSLADLVAAGDYLIHYQLPFTTRRELGERIGAMVGVRGIRLLREALPLLDERAESRRESLLRIILVRGGIAGIRSNYWISLPGVRQRYRVDFAMPELRVVIEYQGDHHRDQAQWRADMTRTSRLEAHGWVVIQVNADDLADPKELLSRIRLVMASRRPVAKSL